MDDEEDLGLQRAFEETEAMFNSDEDLSEWKPVDIRVAKNVKNVYSLRIGVRSRMSWWMRRRLPG